MMTVLEQRFYEVATKQLPRIANRLERIVELLEHGIPRNMDEVRDNEVNDGC